MFVLGIDTATTASGVAVVRGDGGGMLDVLAEVTGSPDQRHAETLLGSIDGCLERAGSALREIDGIAVTVGPGSFTGLRVGLATAKGLALATGAWLIGAPTLRAFAHAFLRARCEELRARDRICVCLDARRGEVYGGLFSVEMDERGSFALRRVLEDAVLRPAELAERLTDRDPGTATLRVVGDGAIRYADELLPPLRRQGGVEVVPSDPLPRAAAAAELALEQFRGEGAPADDVLVPVYLRASEAERKRSGGSVRSAH